MSVGERFVTAVAAKDTAALSALLADDVDFKGLASRRLWEASNHDEVFAVLFDNWFAPEDHIERIAAIEQGEDVEDIHRIGYRFEVTTPDGPHTVEQQAYYLDRDDRIVTLRVMCSGFRPTTR